MKIKIDGKQIREYLRLHWLSLCMLLIGTFYMLVLSVLGANILNGNFENPLTHDQVTGLVLIIIGWISFRFYSSFGVTLEEHRKKKEKGNKN